MMPLSGDGFFLLPPLFSLSLTHFLSRSLLPTNTLDVPSNHGPTGLASAAREEVAEVVVEDSLPSRAIKRGIIVHRQYGRLFLAVPAPKF
jgi:hypothetical protein